MSEQKHPPEGMRIVEEQGATEEQNVKIDAIVGDEVLGYDGSGRGEHSGQESEAEEPEPGDELAHNGPGEM